LCPQIAYSPSDITIYSALKTLQKNEGRDVGIRSSTNYYDISGGVSGGTIASVKAFAESDSRDSNEWSLIDGEAMRSEAARRKRKLAPCFCDFRLTFRLPARH
jgi:hypothetical protein